METKAATLSGIVFPNTQKKYRKYGYRLDGDGKRMKFAKGEYPCGNCNLYKHSSCRPRLDGTLCTCSCAQATEYREEVQMQQNLARERGEQVPTISECLSPLFSAFRKKYYTSIFCA